MQLDKILDILRQIAPEHLAEDWDKVGLHIGDGRQAVKRALLCIDLTEPVLAEAVRAKADLIVAYHPPIFQPVERLTSDSWKQRILIECVRRGIAVYSPHTALDAVEGGVNDWLAAGMGEGTVTVLDPVVEEDRIFKVVTFVPQKKADRIRKAMAKAGAGQIGEYGECSFNLAGFGTFRGSDQTNPLVGKAGQFETVPELRLEMVCPDYRLGEVVAALRATHPYEEAAFDIYPLQPAPTGVPERTGQGRRVELDRAVTVNTLVNRIKQHLGVRYLEVASPPGARKISSVALCAGAGISVVGQILDADCWFTGEMRHHDTLAAVQQGRTVILAGHTQTERPYLPVYRKRLTAATGKQMAWSVSRADKPSSRIV